MTKLSVPAHHRDLPRMLSHKFHKRHEMLLSPQDGVRFECDGCKMPGTGLRYQCGAGCNVDLHVGCALAPPRREIGGFSFAFQEKPKGSRICDACGASARGFIYHCHNLDHDVHPCCAELPDRFKVAGLSFELRMKRPPRRCVLCADDNQDQCSRCLQRALWSYRCDDVSGAVSLHVACAKDLASGDTAVTSVSVDEAYNKVMASESKSVVVADGDGGLKRSKQPSGDAHRTKHSTSSKDKEVIPATTTNRSTSKDIVPVTAKDLRALLLQGRDVAKSKSHGGGALQRSLKVIGFFVRVVIGVIFGDPTAMAIAVAGVFFPNR
ncbi:unnamed protein product [Urochloa humidicola]